MKWEDEEAALSTTSRAAEPSQPKPIAGMSEIKTRIHRKLIERLNLSNLESVSRDDGRSSTRSSASDPSSP
jgi:hypothetical protein